MASGATAAIRGLVSRGSMSIREFTSHTRGGVPRRALPRGSYRDLRQLGFPEIFRRPNKSRSLLTVFQSLSARRIVEKNLDSRYDPLFGGPFERSVVAFPPAQRATA